MTSEKFLGLPKKDAQDLAEKLNMIFRTIRINEKNFFTYPEDERDDRICVEIDNGIVTKALLQ